MFPNERNSGGGRQHQKKRIIGQGQTIKKGRGLVNAQGVGKGWNWDWNYSCPVKWEKSFSKNVTKKLMGGRKKRRGATRPKAGSSV